MESRAMSLSKATRQIRNEAITARSKADAPTGSIGTRATNRALQRGIARGLERALKIIDEAFKTEEVKSEKHELDEDRDRASSSPQLAREGSSRTL
jgi:hypothetical protein